MISFILQLTSKLDNNSGHRDIILGQTDIKAGQDAKIGQKQVLQREV